MHRALPADSATGVRIASALLALAVAVTGCSTEPSSVPAPYTLVAVDSEWTSNLSCFASTADYGTGSPRGDSCNVALRGFTAYFDSSGSHRQAGGPLSLWKPLGRSSVIRSRCSRFSSR
jgi:hypothetical protein